MKEIVIPKENAVFMLDGQGYWRNEDGRFKNKKIIDHFHQSIGKDEGGYFVSQDKGGVCEKVYFPFEDTALFVFDLTLEPDDATAMTLNTGKLLPLIPEQLFIRNDSLYAQTPEGLIKFSERSLMKISPLLEEPDGRLCIRLKNKLHPIAEKE